MGRPKLENPRVNIVVRVLPGVETWINEQAELHGCTKSEIIRCLLVRGVRSVTAGEPLEPKRLKP